MSYNVFALPFFRKQLKKLSRKFPKIKEDFTDLLEILKETPFAGVRVPGIGVPVYKIRMASRDQKRGKSGGYRVIYYFKGKDGDVYLILIYPKSVQENFDIKKVNDLLKEEGLI